MIKMSYLVTMLLTLIMVLSCDRQVNELSSTSDAIDGDSSSGSDSDQSDDLTTNSKSGGSSRDSDNSECYADGTGENSNNYITISPIIGKGKNSGSVQWSSQDDPNFQGSGDQEIFLTDSRLNIRVLANPSPGQTQTTSTS